MVEKLSKNLIPLTIVIVGVVIAGTILYINRGPRGEKAEILSPQQAAERAITYINENILQEQTASLISVVEENQIYKIRLKIEEKEFDSFVTKDGKYLFPGGYNLENQPQKEGIASAPEGQKTDRPDVKLFVMSYCPFGLQAQKMFLPVYDLLKEKTEMGVYFVNYIMHEKKEIDENLRQYCIQREEKEKYYDYLSCFVVDGDFEKCLSEAKIDRAKLQNCVLRTDEEFKITSLYNDKSTWLNGRFPRFDVHADLNEKYGVRGSPTIIVNDSVIVQNQDYCPTGNIKCTVISDFNRSPEKFKEIICQTFVSQPKECSQTFSNESFSPGFGMEKGSSGGSCE